MVWLCLNFYLASQTSRHRPPVLDVSSVACRMLSEDVVYVGVPAVHSRCCHVSSLQWPERVIHCDSAVTSLDFSSNNPSQLAVGMQDGSIAIYNVQSHDNKSCVISSRWGPCVWTAQLWHHTLKIVRAKSLMPLMSLLLTCLCVSVCSECPNKHLGPVWQLRWIQQELSLTGEERVEALFSVAADGRISKWFVCNNGLDCIGTVLSSRWGFFPFSLLKEKQLSNGSQDLLTMCQCTKNYGD